jgi:integrase
MTTICIASAQSVNDYLRWMRTRRLSPRTVGTAKSILNNVAIAVGGDRDLLELAHADLYEWQATRAEQVVARTLRTQLGYLKRFYAWAVAEQLLLDDPAARLETPRVPQLLPHPISEEDLSRAIDEADDRMRAIICLAAYAGLRAAEVADLDWRDVYLSGPEPTLRVVGKGNKERIIDLSPGLVRILSRLPDRRGPVIRRLDGKPSKNTPNRISQAAGRYLRSLGIRASLHWGRHRAITMVYRLGDLRIAQEFAGHASSSTTGGYAQVARRDLRPVVVAAGEIQAS